MWPRPLCKRGNERKISRKNALPKKLSVAQNFLGFFRIQWIVKVAVPTSTSLVLFWRIGHGVHLFAAAFLSWERGLWSLCSVLWSGTQVYSLHFDDYLVSIKGLVSQRTYVCRCKDVLKKVSTPSRLFSVQKGVIYYSLLFFGDYLVSIKLFWSKGLKKFSRHEH